MKNNSKVLSVDAFRAKVLQEVEEICKANGWKFADEQGRGFAFQRWTANLLCAHEGVEEDRIATFTTNDLKFDVIIEDDDQKVLYICQTKFVSVKSNLDLIESEVHDFFSRHRLLLDKADWVHKHASDDLLEYVGDYRTRLDDGWQVHFYFVSTGTATKRQKELVVELEQQAAKDDVGVSFNLIDFFAAKEYYIEAQTLDAQVTGVVEFDIPRNKWLMFEKPHRTIVAVVKANTLVNLYRKERERIFAVNIRSFLGRKGINKDIVATANQHPDSFFYFNNGVSAICTDIDFDEENGHFRGENFQVINGAQTIGALKSAKDLSSETEVLLRITRGESVKTEKGFNADVIRFNNTQNIIKSSDFRSNDPIQLWLERRFSDQRPRGAQQKRIVYVRKRSFKRVPLADMLRLEDMARIRHTWLAEPTRATADPKSLWAFASDGGAYETAFGIDSEPVDFWPEEVFQDALLAVIAYREIEERLTAIIKKERKFLWMRRLRWFALSLFRFYILENNLDVVELLGNRSLFQDVFNAFWKEAHRELISAHYDAVERDKTTVFALARSETRWSAMRDKFQTFLKQSI
jgi:AIPR protein